MNGAQQLRDYQKRLRPIESKLRRYTGVRHVDVGYRYVDGQRTDKLAVRLFVAGPKLARSQAKAKNLAPKSVAGLPIDVVALTRARPAPSALATPEPAGDLLGGLGIGQTAQSAVTLGVVVHSLAFPGPQILTSHEVGYENETVLQFGLAGSRSRPVGHVVNWQPSNMCALVQVDGIPSVYDAVRDLPNVRKVAEPVDISVLFANRVSLQKYGYGTQRTEAILDGGEASDGTVALSALVDGHPPVAGPGDCGSIWMTSDGMAVALHYGSRDSDGAALAQTMHGIRDLLGLSFP